jgi:beta-xylosidase
MKADRLFLAVLAMTLPLALPAQEPTVAANASESTGKVANKPLFRDPVYDGAADPVVIWNPHVQRWWMFYTNRRANAPGQSGVAWVHGTRIGIAESADGGATWDYVGTADVELPKEIGGEEPTHWAPEVFTSPDGQHHMFLTVVPGIFEDWGHPRTIVHLTSGALRHWSNAVPFELASDRVIDACVYHLPDGTWRMWYNNERDKKSIYFADSPDLNTWTDRGKAAGTSERGGEGPKVFRWQGHYWMAVDIWDGIRIYRSDDALNWKRQEAHLLREPGKGEDDQVKGGHPDVVVNDGRAYLFYFTHPGRRGEEAQRDGTEQRRSSIQVVELKYDDGWLTCDRDQPTRIHLVPPAALH